MTQQTAATHTPGPWNVSGLLEGYFGHGEQRHETINADGPTVIASIFVPPAHPNTPNPTLACAANARLIAAAPALLEACRVALENDLRPHEKSVAKDQLLAAIALATPDKDGTP